MENKQELNYINSLDFLRGIAALAVAYFHFTCGNKVYLHEENILKITGHLGWVGVEVFFIISGFVIPYSMFRNGYKINNYGIFVLKRVTRLDPPYIVSILLCLFLVYISTIMPFYRGKPVDFNWLQFVLHFGYLNTFFDYAWYNPVYWTLAIEFQYYLLIALVYPLIVHHKLYIRYIFFVLFGLSSFGIDSQKFIFHFSLLFLFGINLFYYFTNFTKTKHLFIISSFLLILIYLKLGSLVLFASILAFVFIFFVKNVPKPLSIGGKLSYSLYLIHVPIGGRVINYFEQFVSNPIYRSLGVLVAIIITIISAWIFFLIIEKPSTALSKRIKYKNI